MTYPLISAICPTYTRPPDLLPMLNECVYWFLQQDWPNKELIIFNDDAGQTILCDAPQVKVYNLPFRFDSIGAKNRAMLEVARGTYTVLWEDDDISLPHRLRQAAEKLNGGFDFWNPQAYFFQMTKDGGIETGHSMGVGMTSSAFRTEAFRGKYPAWQVIDGLGWYATGHESHDMIADGWAKRNLRVNPETIYARPDQWSYVYRWGMTPNHLSGTGARDGSAWRQRQPGVPGTYRIEPKMRLDYAALCKDAAANHKGAK